MRQKLLCNGHPVTPVYGNFLFSSGLLPSVGEFRPTQSGVCRSCRLICTADMEFHHSSKKIMICMYEYVADLNFSGIFGDTPIPVRHFPADAGAGSLHSPPPSRGVPAGRSQSLRPLSLRSPGRFTMPCTPVNTKVRTAMSRKGHPSGDRFFRLPGSDGFRNP